MNKDKVQTNIDIVQQSIKLYEEFLDSQYDQEKHSELTESMVIKINREKEILEKLKKNHPEYFI